MLKTRRATREDSVNDSAQGYVHVRGELIVIWSMSARRRVANQCANAGHARNGMMDEAPYRDQHGLDGRRRRSRSYMFRELFADIVPEPARRGHERSQFARYVKRHKERSNQGEISRPMR